MTDYFVDSANGDDANVGTDMDNAFETVEHGITQLSADDTLWIRRNVSESPAATITVTNDGNLDNFIRVIGCPRNTHSISSSDWTNGSTSVTVDDNDMDKEKHVGRFVTAPDGKDYLITRVSATNTIIIDREYAGPTVTNQAATIKKDDDYDEFAAIDDSAWTIKVSDWTSDADTLVKIDFSGTNRYLYLNGARNWTIRNLHIDGGSQRVLFLASCVMSQVLGCLLEQSNNCEGVLVQFDVVEFKRCIITGSGAGANTSQRGVQISSVSFAVFKDCAIYNWNDYGFDTTATTVFFENVNIGVEQANQDYDMQIANTKGDSLYGRDVKLGGTNGDYYSYGQSRFSIENYGKVLGANKEFRGSGTITKVDTDGAGDNPNQRSGGNDSVLEILFDNSDATRQKAPEFPVEYQAIFTHEFVSTSGSKNFKYYVQSMANVSASELWIEAEYISSYDDTSEYTITKVESDEAVLQRSNQSDWSQYIETGNISIAENDSMVRIKCYCSFYDAANKIFIDPLVEIT